VLTLDIPVPVSQYDATAVSDWMSDRNLPLKIDRRSGARPM